LIQKALDVGIPAELITAARAVSRTMPLHVAQIVTELLWKTGVHADEAKVLFLGWSYKANVGDPRETPALLIFESLKSKGITVGSWDPHMNYTKFPDEVIPIGSIEDARVMI
jgi:UDP-N-acetyl-D-glucosamine dehydrogenase